ncbi:hypothetical protein GALMADRAFT_237605 [Galerina marginata CBS 339.88]|uniref:EF-hand domain-containing protein n=1 Tax=Galerina marginata (strain CBS 339.88) TaxID=685588 RepID=A0A067TGS0_GALM3|nr:hypothetical protein GALMADRAFT_237605 [Galerina marginata CBS 339.88]
MDHQSPAPASPASFDDDISISFCLPSPEHVISPSSTLEKDNEQLWQDLTRFCDENKHIFEQSLFVEPNDEKTTARILTIDSWVETANLVLDGLVTLGHVHPILGVAIFAFHSVVSLELSRRENNKKIIAVNIQMQNMMCTMFQLRNLRHTHVQESAKEQEKSQLLLLVTAIANDVKKCGSDLTHYADRKPVSKLLNAKKYERRFADHIQKFALRRSELQTALSVYTALGIDAANVAIMGFGQKLNSMDHTLGTVMELLHKLNTPRELVGIQFLKDHGPEACIATDDMLTELLAKAGQSLDVNRAAVGDEKKKIGLLRKELEAELKEDLDEVLTKSVSRFEKLLTVQANNLENKIMDEGYRTRQQLEEIANATVLILEEGKLIRKAVLSNTVKLKDPELQTIWDRMGLKTSVKAKNFVLTLRDHLLTDRSVPGTPYISTAVQEPPPLLLSPWPTLSSEALPSNQQKHEADSDEWVFDFIDVVHVQPVVEAMDEDGSGFISVKEANKFARSRPKGLSLLHWIAYWAAGWHINITGYRTKLYSIMLEMHDAFSSVHLANRAFVGIYLNDWYFRRIEGLLRSMKPVPYDARKEQKISDIAASVAASEEKRLLANLTAMSFVIDSPADVSLIAGSRRVETWILPLLLFVLSRHLEVIKLAKTRILHEEEVFVHLTSLNNIFLVFDTRMRNLEAIFHQTHRDVGAQFANHAYGMFLTSFKGTATYPALNTLLTINDGIPSPSDSVSNRNEPLDVSILVKGLGPTFEYEDPDLKYSEAPLGHSPHPIEGEWIGACTLDDLNIAHQGSFQCIIGPVVDNKISGKGTTYSGLANIEGLVVGTANEGCLDGLVNVSFSIVSSGETLVCQGRFDSGKNIIEGKWSVGDMAEPPPKDGDANSKVQDDDDGDKLQGRFYFTRISPDIFRFQYLLDGPFSDPSWTIARKRWAFATEAVLFQTQCRMGSWNFFRARISERRRWIELRIRGPVTLELTKELLRLSSSIPPIIARLYDELVMYLASRLIEYLGHASCDVCEDSVAFTRVQCITCREEDMTNQIDLCPECIDSLTFSRAKTFVHHLSHSLIRSSRLIHYAELPVIIPQARLLSERIKTSAKASEDKKTSNKDRDGRGLKGYDAKAAKDTDTENLFTSRPSFTALICACCGEDVTLPCWACLTCVLDTLICLDCERKGERVRPREGLDDTHSEKHILLRINDSANIKTSELNGSRVETYLSKMESRINARIDDALEQKVNEVNAQLQVVKKEVTDAVDDVAKHLKNITPNPMTGGPTDDLEVKVLPDNDHDTVEDPLRPRALSSYESRLEKRLDGLEAKVDIQVTQFARLLAMMEEVLSTSRQ